MVYLNLFLLLIFPKASEKYIYNTIIKNILFSHRKKIKTLIY